MSQILSLLKDCAIDYVEASATAATTALTSDVLDMQGWENVCFIAITGDVTDTSVLTLTAYDHTANAASGSAITGAAATFTAGASDADSKLLIVDVRQPQKRYVYAVLTRTVANAVVNGIVAIRYNGHKLPITQGSSVIASTLARGA